MSNNFYKCEYQKKHILFCFLFVHELPSFRLDNMLHFSIKNYFQGHLFKRGPSNMTYHGIGRDQSALSYSMHYRGYPGHTTITFGYNVEPT